VSTADQYIYGKDLVLALLPQAFDYYATPKRDEDESHRGGGDPALGGNHLAHLADIRKALAQLHYSAQLSLYQLAHGEPTEPGFAMAHLLYLLNGSVA